MEKCSNGTRKFLFSSFLLQLGILLVVVSMQLNLSAVHNFPQNAELNKMASESQAMRDELDILRHSSDQVVSQSSLHTIPSFFSYDCYFNI